MGTYLEVVMESNDVTVALGHLLEHCDLVPYLQTWRTV